MTTTDIAGLPAAIIDLLHEARMPQERACDAADIPRTTYYRRLEYPDGFRLRELERLAAAMGCTLRVELAPLPDAVDQIARAHGGVTVPLSGPEA